MSNDRLKTRWYNMDMRDPGDNMPNGEEEDCPHDYADLTLAEGYIEERCITCGKLLDRWQADKDKPMDPGPA